MKKYNITLLTIDGCPHCAQAKEILKDKINSGIIDVKNINKDDKALEIADKHHITAVPTFIVEDNETKLTDVCDLTRDGRKLICKNNKEVEL